jgi:hypothetical protein
MQPDTACLNGSTGDSLPCVFGLVLEDIEDATNSVALSPSGEGLRQLSATLTDDSGSSWPKQR